MLASFRISSSEEFWYKKVLEMNVEWKWQESEDNPLEGSYKAFVVTEGEDATSWSNWGNCNWKIAGCLLLCWTLVCLSLIKGVQSYGKVVYFTTLFPYVILTTMLIYVSTLEGFSEGIKFYLTPDWSKMGNVEIWKQAATQIFYSLGAGEGSQLILSSYNPWNTNAHRDALLIGLCNSLTSIYAGFVVFGVLGFLSVTKGVEVGDVVDQGPGLAFVVSTKNFFQVLGMTCVQFNFLPMIYQSFFWSDALYTKSETKYFSILFHELSIKY